MHIKPLYDRVLVRRSEPAATARAGIIIPDTAKEKPMEAEVVAVGEGRFGDDGQRIPMSVKAGNRVLIGKYTGSDVRWEDVDHVIVREDDILAVLD